MEVRTDIKVGVKAAKAMFFDRKAVTDAVDKATRAVLSKIGSFIRTTARHSIRKRKGVSAPGSPPSSHVGTLKRLIFFGYDTDARSVVVGPTPFGRGDAPALLEQDHVAGTTRRVTRKTRRGRKMMTYKARPFMGPAMEKELPKLPALWTGAIK